MSAPDGAGRDPIDDTRAMALRIYGMDAAGMTLRQIADELHIGVPQAQAALIAATALVGRGSHDNFPRCPSFCLTDHAARAEHELYEGSREHMGHTVELAMNDYERATVDVVRFDQMGAAGPVQVLITCEMSATPALARQLAATILHAAELAERAVAA